jgi:hypothetical protein
MEAGGYKDPISNKQKPKQKSSFRLRGMAQVIEHLPSKCKFKPQYHKKK